MKTNWDALATKLGVLKSDGSELYTGQSIQALEQILGVEWMQHTLNTFIDGTPGNELAIKTLRHIGSTKAATMAYQIFNDNKNTNIQKASMAIWALSDIRTPLSMDYVEEIIELPAYEGVAISVFRNLIFDHLAWFEEKRVYKILEKFTDKYVEEKTTFQAYLDKEYHPKSWYSLLTEIQNKPTLHNILKVEDLYLFYCGYSQALSIKSIVDQDLIDFDIRFSTFIIKDLLAPFHCNWCTAIRMYTRSDSESLEFFFKELAKYKSSKTDFDSIK